MRGFPVSKFQDGLIRATASDDKNSALRPVLAINGCALPLSLLALRNLCEI